MVWSHHSQCLNQAPVRQGLKPELVEMICDLALKQKPQIMVIDSIQVMHVSDVQSAPGSVSQVRESAAYLTRFAKQHHIACT